MPPAFRYIQTARWTVGLTVAISALLGAYYVRTWKTLNAPSASRPYPEAMADVVAGEGTAGVSTAAEVWTAMRAIPGTRTAGTGGAAPSAERFRLAGTFFIDGVDTPRRRAILDDTVKKEQSIVSEGQTLEDVTIEAIQYDHIVITTPLGRRELWVDFASGAAPVVSPETNRMAAASSGTNKFGCVMSQDNRWQVSRKPLLDYYQELLDEPDRMIAVFDSMKPVRNEQNKITGYVLGVEGEQGFFDAVGLRQGDIVRSVNSLQMTNRRRAETFINQFLKQELNAVVLEVERGGKTTKQVYQIKD